MLWFRLNCTLIQGISSHGWKREHGWGNSKAGLWGKLRLDQRQEDRSNTSSFRNWCMQDLRWLPKALFPRLSDLHSGSHLVKVSICFPYPCAHSLVCLGSHLSWVSHKFHYNLLQWFCSYSKFCVLTHYDILAVITISGEMRMSLKEHSITIIQNLRVWTLLDSWMI